MMAGMYLTDEQARNVLDIMYAMQKGKPIEFRDYLPGGAWQECSDISGVSMDQLVDPAHFRIKAEAAPAPAPAPPPERMADAQKATDVGRIEVEVWRLIANRFAKSLREISKISSHVAFMNLCAPDPLAPGQPVGQSKPREFWIAVKPEQPDRGWACPNKDEAKRVAETGYPHLRQIIHVQEVK